MQVIITGGSKGIGKATAELFAAQGHDIFLCARGEMALYKTMEALQTRFPAVQIKAKPVDMSQKKEAIAFAEWCLATAVPDIVVNNAGLFEPGSVADEADGNLESQIQTNLYSAYHFTRTLLPKMKEKKSGHIFTLCSVASLKAYHNGGAYSISKFALRGFTMNLREELKPYGIKVTALYPGSAMTDSWKGFDNTEKRIMEADDVAKMIVACTTLSPQACVEELVIRPQLGDL
ncbi:MAG: SDR family oxidoreductase [Chitinophagaceae bacterium]|nr:SDR family oxidoreductase [Chitinophagaceae bacterium]MCB0741460.1 SDR family oxidoreductase [Chitinophagaceae bacterium]HQU55957.1 SDR family oxidoreductase [Chitinophagaceae bacterium]HQV05256.1 SDR family oxidoreductase [Chitinophagaceae bacterium]